MAEHGFRDRQPARGPIPGPHPARTGAEEVHQIASRPLPLPGLDDLIDSELGLPRQDSHLSFRHTLLLAPADEAIFLPRLLILAAVFTTYAFRRRFSLTSELIDPGAKIKEILHSLEDGIFVVDRNQGLVYVNDALQTAGLAVDRRRGSGDHGEFRSEEHRPGNRNGCRYRFASATAKTKNSVVQTRVRIPAILGRHRSRSTLAVAVSMTDTAATF